MVNVLFRESAAEGDGSMRLESENCRERAASSRVARLATVSEGARPHLVPVTFALLRSTVVLGIDEKPKATIDLKRLRNIRENPRIALLWDRYDEDWTNLWWVRADGIASIIETGDEWKQTWSVLNAKYEQYAGADHSGPCICVEVESWSGWSYR